MPAIKAEGQWVSYDHFYQGDLRVIIDGNEIVKTLSNREVHCGDHTSNE